MKAMPAFSFRAVDRASEQAHHMPRSPSLPLLLGLPSLSYRSSLNVRRGTDFREPSPAVNYNEPLKILPLFFPNIANLLMLLLHKFHSFPCLCQLYF